MQARDDELARLLRAALAGDEKAYAAFLRGVAPIVRGYTARRAGNGKVDGSINPLFAQLNRLLRY